MKKIKEEQLNQIRNQQEQLNKLISQVGTLEANKHALLHNMAGVNQDIEEFKKELEKEYGAINVNVETGEYTEIEVEKEPELSKV